MTTQRNQGQGQGNQGKPDNRGFDSHEKDKRREAAPKSDQANRREDSNSRGQGSTRSGSSDQHAKDNRQNH
jgi:hypothetical protein